MILSMDFKFYLVEQIKKHPSIKPQDVAKMCYQAAFGAEHLLLDTSAAKRYFDAEFEAVEPCEGDLFECISDKVCRVNLGAWKKRELPPERLFDVFVATASIKDGGKARFEGYISEAESCFERGEVESLSFTLAEWRDFLDEYRAAGMPAVHHSEAYRKSEKPAYRIVRRDLIEDLK